MHDRKALILHLVSLLLFGFNGIVAARISISSYDIVLFRTMIGSVLLFLVFMISGGKFHITAHKRDFGFIALSGIAMGTSWMFLYEAYHQLGVGMASLLYYCGPVIVLMLSPVLFKEKLTLTVVIGFLVVVAGVVLVNGKAVATHVNLWGIACGGLSAVTYSLMVTLNKQSRCIVGLENAVIQLIVSFVTVGLFVGYKQHFQFVVPTADWPFILLLGIINTGLGCYLYFSSLSKLTAQTVAVCGYLEALSAVIFSAVFLHERMTVLQIIGAVCIIGGAVLGEWASAKTAKPAPVSQPPQCVTKK